jgi:hypothetical protein
VWLYDDDNDATADANNNNNNGGELAEQERPAAGADTDNNHAVPVVGNNNNNDEDNNDDYDPTLLFPAREEVERRIQVLEEGYNRRVAILETTIFSLQLLAHFLTVAHFLHIWSLHGVQFTLIDGVLACLPGFLFLPFRLEWYVGHLQQQRRQRRWRATWMWHPMKVVVAAALLLGGRDEAMPNHNNNNDNHYYGDYWSLPVRCPCHRKKKLRPWNNWWICFHSMIDRIYYVN